MQDRGLEAARQIMAQFAERTGLGTDGAAPRRYLWTDAFAVCNFLELQRESGEREALDSARLLVTQVHATLGRHRADDPREGWISGLSEEEGSAYPTRRGLRIGKPRNERGPGEAADERLEWDRDGQYFHYLTKWMHALARVGRVTDDERYLRWAIELAGAAHVGFTWATSSGERRMVWKMSIDLSRPLVASMGQHDPLDGLLTFLELRCDAQRAGWTEGAAMLDRSIAEMRTMCEGVDWTTLDPLGLGGLLADAYRLAQISRLDAAADAHRLSALLSSSLVGLSALARSRGLEGPASQRLAFRDLGLAIGLHAVPRLERLLEGESPAGVDRRELADLLEALNRFVPLAEGLETFWLDPAHQAVESWREHPDINSVMLVTSLVPDGYLSL